MEKNRAHDWLGGILFAIYMLAAFALTLVLFW